MALNVGIVNSVKYLSWHTVFKHPQHKQTNTNIISNFINVILPLLQENGFYFYIHLKLIEQNVIGSGEGLWLDTAEWLIQRGARKLLIALDKDIHTTNFCRRFDRLIDLSYVRIMLTSASRINCEENTADLIREVESLGPVSGIFCVALVSLIYLIYIIS